MTAWNWEGHAPIWTDFQASTATTCFVQHLSRPAAFHRHPLPSSLYWRFSHGQFRFRQPFDEASRQLAKKESSGKRNKRWRFKEGRDFRRYRDCISYISSLPLFIVQLFHRLTVALSLGEQNIELTSAAASSSPTRRLGRRWV